jgi:hypothetical protein
VVDNNMRALLAITLIGLLIMLVQFIVQIAAGNWTGAAEADEPAWFGVARFVGYFSIFVAWGFLTWTFLRDFEWFRDHMHYIAAGVMFIAIFIVVCINAVRSDPTYRLIYGGIAVEMVGTAIYFGLHSNFKWRPMHLVSWDQWLLWFEVSQISGFALFWLVQTVHGRKGLVGHPALV